MHWLRMIALFLAAYLFMNVSAFGQEAPANEETSPEITGNIVAVEKLAPADAALPQIDLDDPAIRAAIEAKEEADRAFAEAVRNQLDAAQLGDEVGDEVSDNRPSLIPSNSGEVKALFQKILDKILGWLTSIKFLAQVGAIALAYILSPIIGRIFRKKIFLFRDKPAEDVKLKLARDYLYRAGALLRPIVLVVLLIFFGAILKAVPLGGAVENAGSAGSVAAATWLIKIAQSLAVVFLLYKAIKEFIPNDLIQKLAIWTAIPLALIMLFGYYDDLIDRLNSVVIMRMGDTPISLMTVILLLIFGALFFKLGNIANAKGQSAIRSQEGLDVATQEVVGKLFQIILFTVIFILVMGAAKVPLSGLVVIFSALSLGVGLGLQPIAANFVSGMIILFDRSVRVGDFVVLPDGQEGFVEAINMRNTVVETTDGKDIMVPNTTFTDDSYENWTHKDPRQRYEVHFTVSYNTDLDTLEDIILPVFHSHPSVLEEPEMPDLEFREFGEYGVKMAVEFWCSGIDDGPNKFTSDLNFAVWRVLRENKIQIPFPQMTIHKA